MVPPRTFALRDMSAAPGRIWFSGDPALGDICCVRPVPQRVPFLAGDPGPLHSGLRQLFSQGMWPIKRTQGKKDRDGSDRLSCLFFF
jgi:hypothetical protein